MKEAHNSFANKVFLLRELSVILTVFNFLTGQGGERGTCLEAVRNGCCYKWLKVGHTMAPVKGYSVYRLISAIHR